MKYYIFIFSIFSSVLLSAQPSSDSCQFTVQGRVIDTDDDGPLELANILLPDLGIGTQADFDGNFVLNNICPGITILRISHVGCVTREYKLKISSDTTLIFHLDHAEVQLDDFVITEHVDAYNGTLKASTVNSAQLDKLSGRSLGEMLKSVNGVWSLQTGPTISKPVVHGLHSNRILILNNGVRQEGQQWGSEHGPEIDPFIASEITVVQGAASVRYGSDAMGGVVLVQAPGISTDTSIHGAIQMAGFSNTLGGTASAYVEGRSKKQEAFGWRLQGTLKGGGDTQTPHYRLANTAYREANFSTAAEWATEHIQTELYYSRFASDIGILSASHIGNLTDLNIALAADTPLILRDFSYDINSPYQHIVHQLVKSFTSMHTGEIGHLDITLAYQDNVRQEYDQDRDPTDGPSLDFRIGSLSLDAEWKYLGKDHLLFGSPLNGSIGISGMNQQNVWSGRYFIPNFISNTLGVFWLGKWYAGAFSAEAGIRYDIRQLSVYRNDGSSVQRTDRNFAHLSWAAGGNYRFGEKSRLYFNTGTAWRSPSINELYASGLHHGAAALEYGDENLQQETAWNNALSLEYGGKRLYAEAGVYVNFFDNFIYLEPLQPPALTIAGAFPVFAYKQTTARISGADAVIRYVLVKELELEVRGSMLRAYDISNGQWIIQMPADRLSGGINWHFHDRRDIGWDITAQYAYVAEQTRIPAAEDYASPPAAYSLIAATAGSSFSIGDTQIIWSVEGSNLLNTVYRDYLNRFRYYADEAGRNITLRIKIPFIF
jgi:iron complex outermembrane receptor protein